MSTLGEFIKSECFIQIFGDNRFITSTEVMTFRSIPMAHFRLFLPRQNYYTSVEELLNMGKAHVVDIGNPLNRPFFNQHKRIDELLVKIRTMTQALKEKQMHLEEYNELDDQYVNDLQMSWKALSKQLGIEHSKLLDHYDNEITDQWQRYIEKKNGLDRLKANKQTALSKIACFEALTSFFGSGVMNQLQLGGEKGISSMVGVIDPASQLKLERTIYRVSRGFAFFKTVDNFSFEGLRGFSDRVVLLVYPNSSSGVLQKKLMRIMQTFTTTLLQFKQGQQTTAEMEASRREFEEVVNLIDMNERQMNKYLEMIGNRHCLETWRTYLWKERLIYQTLNSMILKDHFLVADVYIPQNQRQELRQKISRITPAPEIQELIANKPPTAFDTNIYTAVAQEITDTYGVPRYQEINPAIFTTVTFPFFFGVMFGDMGHGLILFILGIYLLLNNDNLKNTSLRMVCDLRYMVLMMGFFAFYCGWIYNDFLGMNLNIFGSCYTPIQVDKDRYIAPDDPECIYPFGIDPIWGVSGNQLVFVNGLKMKISVIIAIIHMSVGVILKLFNAVYFRRTLEVIFEFIPQIIFLGLLFGYMDFLIIYKWLTNWDCQISDTASGYNSGIKCNPDHMPPSIITTMMDIGLKVGSTEKAGAMWGISGDSSQDSIQLFILLIAFICIPWMLIPKPCIQISRNKKVKKMHPLLEEELRPQKNDEQSKSSAKSQKASSHDLNFGDNEPEHEEHDSSQIFVHQLIETIEFILGAISNTASYLRLWALSLAHSQLAKVFFQKTLESGYTGDSAYMAIVTMPIFFYVLVWVTFGVLMCMDTMQCFLHSLRLHWVQFQNKFYKGDGYKYEPVAYKSYILKMKEESEK